MLMTIITRPIHIQRRPRKILLYRLCVKLAEQILVQQMEVRVEQQAQSRVYDMA